MEQHRSKYFSSTSIKPSKLMQQEWKKFLITVQRERISLFFCLSNSLFALTPTALHIEVEKESYFRELTQMDNCVLLEDLVSRFFRRSLEITIQLQPIFQQEFIVYIEEGVSNNDPCIKEALKVLGGVLSKGVRSIRIRASNCQIIEVDGENCLLCNGSIHLILRSLNENRYKLIGQTECSHDIQQHSDKVIKPNA